MKEKEQIEKENLDKDDFEPVRLDLDKLDKNALKDLAKGLIDENCEMQSEMEKINIDLQRANKIASKTTDLNTMYNSLLKDFENYKRRNSEIKEIAKDDGLITAALKIIPIYDNLLRAVESIDEKEKEGIIIIAKSFEKVLEEMNVKKIEAKGAEYDHELHEAISVVKPNSKKEEGKIVKVISNGYMYKDKVIKHAQVIVART
ncbi:MAG: nucleotide exchange factor GrpE [Firmicutes bacterium]|nr:nucleotide exchange factor GrpE [Bacillota bacterium]